MSRGRAAAGLVLGVALVVGVVGYSLQPGAVPIALLQVSQGAGERSAPEGPDREGLRRATPEEIRSAKASIEAQLKAFLEDDYEKAARFQSSNLKRNFATPEEFRRAMQRGYPQFARYRSISYGEILADEKGDRVVVHVRVTGRDGATVRAVYVMLREEKEYRVDGVFGGAPAKSDPRDIV